METKHVICTVCDNCCQLAVDVENEQICNVRGLHEPATVCYKAKIASKEFLDHP